MRSDKTRSRRLSGENAAARNEPSAGEKEATSRPVTVSQSCTERSRSPVAISRPSGEKESQASPSAAMGGPTIAPLGDVAGPDSPIFTVGQEQARPVR